jgi:hypothetical protein
MMNENENVVIFEVIFHDLPNLVWFLCSTLWQKSLNLELLRIDTLKDINQQLTFLCCEYDDLTNKRKKES